MTLGNHENIYDTFLVGPCQYMPLLSVYTSMHIPSLSVWSIHMLFQTCNIICMSHSRWSVYCFVFPLSLSPAEVCDNSLQWHKTDKWPLSKYLAQTYHPHSEQNPLEQFCGPPLFGVT